MIRIRLSELAAALGCPVTHPAGGHNGKDVAVESIVTDSRRRPPVAIARSPLVARFQTICRI